MSQPLLNAPSPPAAVPQTGHFLFLFLEVFEQEGGIQSYVRDLLSGYATIAQLPPAKVMLLRDRHHSAADAPQLQFCGYQSQSTGWGRLRFSIALLIQVLRQRPQRVFCGHINLALLVQAVCQPLGVPYTVLTYGKEVWTPLPWFSRNALRQADQIWAISRYSRDRASVANQLNPKRFRLLPCAIDGDRFQPGDRSALLLERYGLADAKVLMTVARLWSGDRYKGVDVTIQALPAIAVAVPAVKYLVIGRGDDQPRLAQLARDLGVSDRVIFAGFVPTADLAAHYRLADAYVMPSQEGFGIAYLEALACGIPVLAGSDDGSAEPLQDGQLGWHVPHRDPVAVASACVAMLTHTARERRCDRAWLRQQTLAQFGQAAFRDRLRQLFAQS